jgi:hypothetical protein
LGVAVVSLLIAGTTFSTASRLATSLQGFVKRSVRVQVWGIALPPSVDAVFEVDSIFALGAGLQIFLRSTPGGPPTQLKVAQPKSASVTADTLEIGEAAYISWAGRNLPRSRDKTVPALTFSLS